MPELVVSLPRLSLVLDNSSILNGPATPLSEIPDKVMAVSLLVKPQANVLVGEEPVQTFAPSVIEPVLSDLNVNTLSFRQASNE